MGEEELESFERSVSPTSSKSKQTANLLSSDQAIWTDFFPQRVWGEQQSKRSRSSRTSTQRSTTGRSNLALSSGWDFLGLSLSPHRDKNQDGGEKTSASPSLSTSSIFSNQVLTSSAAKSASHRSFLAPKLSPAPIGAGREKTGGPASDCDRGDDADGLKACRQKRRIRTNQEDGSSPGGVKSNNQNNNNNPQAALKSGHHAPSENNRLQNQPTPAYQSASANVGGSDEMANMDSAPMQPTISSQRTTFRPPPRTPHYKTPPSVFNADSSPERRKEIQHFYKNYNPTEGLVTAIVLGGFFVFVSLLVIYKTKCKPMWKNRRKRLTNTPATHSNGDNENSFYNIPSFPPNIHEERPSSDEDSEPQNFGDPNEEDENEEDECDDDFEFECIPLKSVYAGGEDEDEEDIYFLDEYGNYVFPVSPAPTSHGSALGAGRSSAGCCSCEPNPDDDSLDFRSAILRRQSQASAISNAYTVKSLPGASYLYIPVLDARSVSLNSVGRSLSDPEIRFSPPFNHPIILTVNPTTESGGTSLHGNNTRHHLNHLPQFYHSLHPNSRQLHPRHHPKLQQRSHSIQPDGSAMATAARAVPASHHRLLPSHPQNSSGDMENDIIAIQIIQATPNISPTCSLRSFSGEGNSIEALGASSGYGQEIPVTITTLSPTSSLKKSSLGKPATDRRVSFSEDSIDEGGGGGSSHRSYASSSPVPFQNHHLIPSMNYLQVPGQPPSLSFVVPTLTPEARAAQTSPQARHRRATRLMKTGSFCSITSEGESEIFGPTGELLPTPPTMTTSRRKKQLSSSCDSSDLDNERAVLSRTGEYDGLSSRSSIQSKSTFDPLSEYSEFQDDCCSDISELFVPNDDEGGPRLHAQGTLSDQGSLRSLSLDEDDPEEDITAKESPQYRDDQLKHNQNQRLHNPEYDQIMQHQALLATEENDVANDADDDGDYTSSSCSLSMGSECERSHRITVPVTIEAPPPELRHAHRNLMDSVENLAVFEPLLGQALGPLEGLVEPGPHFLQERAHLAHQETLHTDSGLDTEDIAPASPPSNTHLGTHPIPDEMASLEENVRLVLVRDIGIQVCGDSPNLNLGRRFPPHHSGYRRSGSGEKPATVAPPPTREPSRENSSSPSASKDFAPEILF